MEKSKTRLELSSEKYGNFIVCRGDSSRGKYIVWWDFYDEHDGFMLEPGEQIELALDCYSECDVRDFSDLPKNGEFKSMDEAKEYIEEKFELKFELE